MAKKAAKPSAAKKAASSTTTTAPKKGAQPKEKEMPTAKTRKKPATKPSDAPQKKPDKPVGANPNPQTQPVATPQKPEAMRTRRKKGQGQGQRAQPRYRRDLVNLRDGLRPKGEDGLVRRIEAALKGDGIDAAFAKIGPEAQATLMFHRVHEVALDWQAKTAKWDLEGKQNTEGARQAMEKTILPAFYTEYNKLVKRWEKDSKAHKPGTDLFNKAAAAISHELSQLHVQFKGRVKDASKFVSLDDLIANADGRQGGDEFIASADALKRQGLSGDALENQVDLLWSRFKAKCPQRRHGGRR